MLTSFIAHEKLYSTKSNVTHCNKKKALHIARYTTWVVHPTNTTHQVHNLSAFQLAKYTTLRVPTNATHMVHNLRAFQLARCTT